MKSYKFVGKMNSFKYVLLSFLNVNKVRLFTICFFILLGLLTGIFTAIKYNNGCDLLNFNDYGLTQFANGNIASSELFFERMLSYTVFTAIIWICSLAAFLMPIGLFMFAYRAYLLGLNLCLMVLLYGIGGVLTAILIIFPMQLALLLLVAIFYCIMRNRSICKKKYGKVYGMNAFLIFLVFNLLLTVVNLAETLLLLAFSAQVILVI